MDPYLRKLLCANLYLQVDSNNMGYICVYLSFTCVFHILVPISCFIILVFSLLVKMFSDFQVNEKL